MNDNDNFDLDSELAKSIEKLVDEETTVAKAFVDRNSLQNDINKHSKYDEDRLKTQAIPNIPSRNVVLDNDLDDDLDDDAENLASEEKNVTDTLNGDLKPSKKKLDKKSKLIIAGISAVVILVIAAIIIVSVIASNKKKSSYDYNYSQGVERYNSKDYESALDYFKKAELSSNGKKNLDLKFKLYDCYMAVGESDKAIEELKDVLSYEKNNEKALTALSGCYSDNKQGDKLTELIRQYKGTDGLKYLTKYVVSEPTASQTAGKYQVAVDLELTSDNSNKIYYTLDGTDPTTKSLLYSQAINLVKGETTVKTIAVNSIGTSSDIVEMKFQIDYKAPDAPDVTPVSGDYDEGQKIEITNLKSGDTAYYTTDGSTPTKSSTPYTEAFIMPTGNKIISVLTVNQYDQESSITRRNYNVVVAKTYTFNEALDLLKARMIAKGDMKADGTSADGKKADLGYYTKKTIDNVEMFVSYYDIGGKRQAYYFGIAVKSGQCYKVSESGGKFTATEY